MDVRRTLSILRAFWSTSLAAESEYRGNFVVAALTSVGNLAGAAFSIWLFYRQGAGFAGWSIPEVTVVLGLFSLWTGVVGAVLFEAIGAGQSPLSLSGVGTLAGGGGAAPFQFQPVTVTVK